MIDETPPEGKFERLCMWVPILGWAIASMLNASRLTAFTVRADEILKSRPPTEPARWGDVHAQEIAKKVCKLINDEIWWVNDHFIPEDQLRAVAFAQLDGLDDVAAFMDIKDEFKLAVADDWWVDLMRAPMTMGEFVTWLREHSRHHVETG